MATAVMFKGPAALTTGSTITAGASTFTSTVGITGNTTVGGTLAITGATTCAALTSSGLITAGTLDLGNSGKVVTSISATTGTGDDILTTKAYVDAEIAAVGGGNTVVTITSTPGSSTPLAANNAYFISSNAASVVVTFENTTTPLLSGDIVRVFAESVGFNTITLTGATFKLAGGTASSIVMNTDGQGLQFMFNSGALNLIGGGFASSS